MAGENPYGAPEMPTTNTPPRTRAVARGAARLLVTVGLGAVVVATPIPINLAGLIVWAVLVGRWAKAEARIAGGRACAGDAGVQLAVMCALVAGAAWAPGKVVDRVKARRVPLPRQVMTVAELKDPASYSLAIPLYYAISAPDELADRVVRFPRQDPTVGEFIRTIEAQTPLRHRFGHCGNGWTILWGGDCSFGLFFSTPG